MDSDKYDNTLLLVAATLTTGSLGAGTSAVNTVKRFREIVEELQKQPLHDAAKTKHG